MELLNTPTDKEEAKHKDEEKKMMFLPSQASNMSVMK